MRHCLWQTYGYLNKWSIILPFIRSIFNYLDIRSFPSLALPQATSVDSLCKSCAWARQNAPVSSHTKRSGRRTVNVSGLILGAAEGCWQCNAIQKATTELWGITRQQLELMMQIWVRYDAEAFTVHGQSHLPVLQLYTSQGEPQVPRIISASEILQNPGSPRSFNFIKHQLNQCLERHGNCQRYFPEMRRALGSGAPKRMLWIDSKKDEIRLVDFQPSMSQRYVALSYCWGNHCEHVTAIESTLQELKSGFAIARLPATLRDAIEVSQGIGVELIWIDSMCIVQDDPKDWEVEAAKMSTVYSNALVTIIAGSARSCNEGFLAKHRKPPLGLGFVRTDNKIVEVKGRLLRDWGYHRNAGQGPQNRNDQWLDPIDSRGWVLQERLLSNRYINFTTGELQWNCQDTASVACECGQPVSKDHLGVFPENQWHAIVQEYTKRSLTNNSDTLTALAGIARKYSVVLDKQTWTWYAAGIWLGPQLTTLSARSLLWFRWSRNSAAYFPENYLGPSFSWASVVGEVTQITQIPAEGVHYPTTVSEVHMESTTSDRFGQVRDGYVRLRGPLIPAKMSMSKPGVHLPDRDAKIDLLENLHTAVITVYPDGVLEKVPQSQAGYTVRRVRANNLQESERYRQVIEFEDAEVFMLPVTADLRNLMKPGKLDSPPSGEALILARSVTGPGYERIAQASYRKYQGDWSDTRLEEIVVY